ncbi:hypothetical protein CLF_109844 [Clonorchis sinensis]|uniref:Uncharacterized protein n=1 Tax=Clonorchis sinensis TaxID=79923 RepID=G7YSZ6_CLOSI|nr:hypothetical protein CLF_109844 [Clonorchis sinensis]
MLQVIVLRGSVRIKFVLFYAVGVGTQKAVLPKLGQPSTTGQTGLLRHRLRAGSLNEIPHPPTVLWVGFLSQRLKALTSQQETCFHYLRGTTISQQYRSEQSQQLPTVNQYCCGIEHVDETACGVKVLQGRLLTDIQYADEMARLGSDAVVIQTILNNLTNSASWFGMRFKLTEEKKCGELFIGCCTNKGGCIKNITTPILKSQFTCPHPAEEMWVVIIRYTAQCKYNYHIKWVYGKCLRGASKHPGTSLPCVAANILACNLATWLNADTLVENVDVEKCGY